MNSLSLTSILIACFSRFAIASPVPLTELGCALHSPQKPGLEANFYSYALNAGDDNEPKSWFLEGIKDTTRLGTKYNVIQPKFEFEAPPASSTAGDIYGLEVPLSHFAVELTGYYRASATGEYTFRFQDCDDGCALQFGRGTSVSCGNKDFDSILNKNNMILQYWPNHVISTETLQLVEGYYYPIRIAYYNSEGAGSMTLSVQKPGDSRSSDDLTGDLFQPNVFVN